MGPAQVQAANPFAIPGWESTPLRPLRPWAREEHRDYYVDVGGTESAFQHARQELGDLSGVVEDGRFVLVTGESGCGKTALVNRCADWAVSRLAEQGTRAVVFDLMGCLPEDLEMTIDQRSSMVSDRIFDSLVDHDVLLPGVADRLAEVRDVPSRLLPRLGGALRPDTVLVVLLPSPNELADEVIRYCRMLSSPRVLFLAESAFLYEDDVADIMRRLEAGVPPVALRVGGLEPGDAQRFIGNRLWRHREHFAYPELTDDAVELLAKMCQSIAMLQRITHRVYERWLHAAPPFADPEPLTVDDIRRLLWENAGVSG